MSTSVACLAVVTVVQPPLPVGTAGTFKGSCAMLLLLTLAISQLHTTHLL